MGSRGFGVTVIKVYNSFGQSFIRTRKRHFGNSINYLCEEHGVLQSTIFLKYDYNMGVPCNLNSNQSWCIFQNNEGTMNASMKASIYFLDNIKLITKMYILHCHNSISVELKKNATVFIAWDPFHAMDVNVYKAYSNTNWRLESFLRWIYIIISLGKCNETNWILL